MAINTVNKRRSVIQIPSLTLAPVADGTIDDNDRRQMAYIYCGFETTGTTGGQYLMLMGIG
jgi:hypothetical protein